MKVINIWIEIHNILLYKFICLDYYILQQPKHYCTQENRLRPSVMRNIFVQNHFFAGERIYLFRILKDELMRLSSIE